MTFATHLTARVRQDGASPLVTWYGPGPADRVELSAITFANWVDKTTNLLFSLGVSPGDVVALPLLAERPGHWVSLVWVAAVWQAGASAEVGTHPEAVVTVTGPGGADGEPQVVACSLHPWGWPLAEPVAGAIDYAEVLGQPDAHAVAPPVPGAPAWVDHSRTLTPADIDAVTPRADRALVVEGEPWDWIRAGLVSPVLGGGSTVLVEGGHDLDALAEAERVTD